MSVPSRLPRAIIFGCSGPALLAEERRFFARADPLGFILFARNCETAEQIRALVADLRGSVRRENAPVLIDQEGGRVARLKPPHWRAAPAAAVFGALAGRDPDKAAEAAYLNARLIAAELHDLGITVNCAPVLDLPAAGSHRVIGERAYCDRPEVAARLGRRACDGFLDGGVLPVLKHIPGHGRATADSHQELPVVEATRADLEALDFKPFRELADMPWAMTAHVVYEAFDSKNPATLSPTVIAEVIRGDIGFDGILISDDLSMKALSGDMAERSRSSLDAGCDLVLHCNGVIAEMEAVASGARRMTAESWSRLEPGKRLGKQPQDFDKRRFIDGLNALLKDPRVFSP